MSSSTMFLWFFFSSIPGGCCYHGPLENSYESEISAEKGRDILQWNSFWITHILRVKKKICAYWWRCLFISCVQIQRCFIVSIVKPFTSLVKLISIYSFVCYCKWNCSISFLSSLLNVCILLRYDYATCSLSQFLNFIAPFFWVFSK